MFVHSGASFHGHEFSKRAPQSVGHPRNLRNPLLRSSLPSSPNRASTIPTGLSLCRNNDVVPDLKKSKTYLEPIAGASTDLLANSEHPSNDFVASRPEAMSDDGTSVVSDIDSGRASPAVSRKRRSDPQKNTAYVLAHPPPKPRTKQRIIHMRPNLVLQIQEVTPGLRPRPTIDVYPSFAGARSIMAPLLGRDPRIADIKRELSGQDIMLVRSEDYASQNSGSESDLEEDGIVARDLLAILSPSRTEDKTEIVTADGIVWVATTRSVGSSYSYEFTSVNSLGTSITARWVRKQTVASSLPSTPNSNSAKPHLSDVKFTFSIIDPNCRRHPVLATLTNTSLIIPETYTTIPPSANRYSLPPQTGSPADSAPSNDQNHTAARTLLVEEWQKSFISISAVWVALRNGWAPEFRPDEIMPFRTSTSSQMDGCLHSRQRSHSTSADSSLSSPVSETTGRRKYPIGLRHHMLRSTNDAPRRTTSTSAAQIQKRRATLQNHNSQLTDSENSWAAKLNRRALSGDWNVGLLKGALENSLAETAMDAPHFSPRDDSEDDQAVALAPPPKPSEHHSVPASTPLSPPSPCPSEHKPVGSDGAPADVAQTSREPNNVVENGSKRKHRKLKSMANWFRKLSAR